MMNLSKTSSVTNFCQFDFCLVFCWKYDFHILVYLLETIAMSSNHDIMLRNYVLYMYIVSGNNSLTAILITTALDSAALHLESFSHSPHSTLNEKNDELLRLNTCTRVNKTNLRVISEISKFISF